MRDCRNVETIPIGISLKSLEKLDLDGCSRLRTLPQISTNIVHLCLSETAIEEFPSDLHLENLRFEKLSYLSMQNLKSKKLWEKVQPLIFLTGIMSPSMRQLYLSDIPSLVELPSSFQNLHQLEKLKIENCVNLETLPTGINLQSLEELDLSGCSKLRTFPDISTNIQTLNLNETEIEEVPCWIEKFSRLEVLYMNDCINLETLPTGINLQTLSFLYLNGCSRLRTFPGISTNIVCLYLSETAIEEVPWWIEKFSRLRVLYMNGCINLETVLDLDHRYLDILNLSGCSKLRTFPNISTNIRRLNLSETGIEEVPCWIGKFFFCLLKLKMSGCSKLRTFPNISTNIVRLNLNETAIEEVPCWIEKFSKLEILKMKGCINLETLPTGINLQSLRELNLSGCSRLRTFPDISTNIQWLYLSETAIEEVPPWIEKSLLHGLYMNGCINLETLPTGINLQHLEVLDLRGCSRLRTFPDISTNIEYLDLSETAIEEVPCWIEKFTRLKKLEMNGCINLETLSTGINLQSLRLRTFPDISTNIRWLNLSETAIEEVPRWIEKFSRLEFLGMNGCINLETLPTGIDLKSLRNLNLRGCSRLRTFPDISTNIKYLYLSETAIEEVPCWIEKFTRLEELEMNGCNKLKSVSLNISKLGDPYLVDFSDCKVMTGGSWSFSGGCTTFANFTNCLNLDQEALFRQNTHLGCRLCLSGEEVPSYFTHRTTVTSSSSSLTVRLLPSSLSNPFLRFRACIVLNEDNSAWVTSFGFKGRFWNSFDSFGQAQYFQKPKKISSMKKSVKGSYLLILECSIQAEMNYTHVDLQLDFAYCEYKVKEWGIRLCSSADNQLGSPNTLPHVFQTGEGNTLNEAGQGKKSGGEDEVTESSSKRMRIS